MEKEPPERMYDMNWTATSASDLEEVESAEKTDSLDVVSKYLVGIFLSVLIFFSITGNLLVCLAIYTDKRLRKLSNLFLVSLAVADLFVASLVMTFAMINDIMGYWMFGARFCDTWIAFDVMCCTASILNLCAISLDRFIHIKDPLCYDNWMTKRVVFCAILSVWILSGLVSFLPISFGWHKRRSSPMAEEADDIMLEATPSYLQEDAVEQGPTCAMDLTPTYAIVSSTISFYIPCVIMIALYTRLYLCAREHLRNIKAMNKPALQQQQQQSGSDAAKNSGKGHRNFRTFAQMSHHIMEHKAAITLGFIMGVFLICWVPFFCVNIVAAVCESCIPLAVFKILTWLGYCNSALNPVIYSIFNTEFREAFRKILLLYFKDECCSCCEQQRRTDAPVVSDSLRDNEDSYRYLAPRKQEALDKERSSDRIEIKFDEAGKIDDL